MVTKIFFANGDAPKGKKKTIRHSFGITDSRLLLASFVWGCSVERKL